MFRIKSALTIVLLLAFFAVGIHAQNLGKPGEQTGKGTVVLKAARIIDGTGKSPINNGVIVIKDDKIVAVGTSQKRQNSSRCKSH